MAMKITTIVFALLLLVSVIAAENYAEKIHKFLSEHRKDKENIAVLQRWIQQPSLPGNEKSQQDLMVEALNKLKFDVVDVWELDNVTAIKKENPLFNTPRDSLKGSPIVVGVLKGEAGKTEQVTIDPTSGAQQSVSLKTAKSIILNGHIDVVPEGDVSAWKRPPFSGHYDEENQRIHGRGTTDMKGGIFSSLIAVETIVKLGIKLKGDVIFESVIEEEAGGAGTMATIMRGYKADVALIPEPTKLKIFPKQQGSSWFRITVKGIAAHGGTRYEGVSAIEKAMVVINTLLKLEEERNKKVMEEDELYRKSFSHHAKPIPVPINVGVIKGGKWPSSVADEVILEGRMGIIPGETKAGAQAIMKATLDALPSIDAFFEKYPVSLEWFGGTWIPGNVELNHPFMEVLTKSFKTMLHQDPVVEASPWGTDGGYLTHYGTPAVVFGPGDTELAHQTDETISLDAIYKCAEVIAMSLLEWCEVANE